MAKLFELIFFCCKPNRKDEAGQGGNKPDGEETVPVAKSALCQATNVNESDNAEEEKLLTDEIESIAKTTKKVILSLTKHAIFSIVKSKTMGRTANSEFLLALNQEFKKIKSYKEFAVLSDIIIKGYSPDSKILADSLAHELAKQIVANACLVCQIVVDESEGSGSDLEAKSNINDNNAIEAEQHPDPEVTNDALPNDQFKQD